MFFYRAANLEPPVLSGRLWKYVIED